MSGLKMLSVMGVAGFLALSLCMPCFAQITLPATGVDVAGHVEALITALGSIVAVALGGFVAYLLIRKGIVWLRRATT